jgi:hypothetical protein
MSQIDYRYSNITNVINDLNVFQLVITNNDLIGL